MTEVNTPAQQPAEDLVTIENEELKEALDTSTEKAREVLALRLAVEELKKQLAAGRAWRRIRPEHAQNGYCIGVRDAGDGWVEYLCHNEALGEPYYLERGPGVIAELAAS